jgi:hypothetical protein
MGVKGRVAGPREPVAEAGGHQPGGRLALGSGAAAPEEGGVVCQVAEGGIDGPLVGRDCLSLELPTRRGSAEASP